MLINSETVLFIAVTVVLMGLSDYEWITLFICYTMAV